MNLEDTGNQQNFLKVCFRKFEDINLSNKTSICFFCSASGPLLMVCVFSVFP